MSSSEEDDQEEELLQRALAEQAQRKTQFQRPANYPPPVVSASAAGPPSRQPPPPTRLPPKPPPIEDEEESEEELLSISSEDEAPSSQRKPALAVDARKVSHAEEDELSDLEWDEDDNEPRSWKMVDETELVRRVREMRETKTAPTEILGRARRPTMVGRRATMINEPLPKGEDLIDPLGLGILDIKSLTLVRSNNAASHSEKVSVKPGGGDTTSSAQPDTPAVRDHLSREKVLYHSENFDPKFFLARIHQNTSAADLEAGDVALKRDLQNRKQQLKKLVKENFDCFISCKNTIDDIHSKLQQIEEDPEGSGTLYLSGAIQAVDGVAKRAFGPLLERQAQAERIRSVQGMLQRFRTLFNLPSAIRANISKGEYDMAVREYKKAKSLVLPSHVGILKKVLEEVEKVVQELKDMLFKFMEDPHIDVAHLENTIRILLELEPDSDPVWHYLNIQMDALHGRVREKVQSDARWKQLQRESNTTSEVDLSLLLGEQDRDAGETQAKDSAGDESDALLLRLIRRLTAVIIRYVPHFWQLALSIFNGKFAKVSQPGTSGNGTGLQTKKARANQSYYGNYQFEDKTGDMKYTTHSLEEVILLVHGILSLYESKVQNAFLALADASEMRPYMQEAVEEISKACISLEGNDCAPPSAVQALLVLRTEVTRVFILRLCALMRGATSELVNDEEWIPVAAVQRSGSPFAISSLPLRFRDMLMSTIDYMKQTILRLKNEASVHEEMGIQFQQMQETVKVTFFECFCDLTECLERVAGEISESNLQEENIAIENGQLQSMDKFSGLQVGLEVVNSHQRYLMLLSNIGYSKNLLLPELSRKYEDVWSYDRKGRGADDGGSSKVEEVEESFSVLEEKILSQYNYAKATLVGTAAAAYLLDDGTPWSAAPPVKGVRDAVIELLHPLIAVHAEVYAGAKPYQQKVLSVLVEGLLDALLNIFSDSKTKALRSFDVNGYCQLMLEWDYIENVLHAYFTSSAGEALRSLRELLLQKVPENGGELTENMGHSRRPTRGGEDGFLMEERLPNGITSGDDILNIARKISGELLSSELKRTRVNTMCFMDGRLLEPTPEAGKQTASLPSNFSVISSQSQRGTAMLGRHRRMSSGSSISESDSGKPYAGLPPVSPFQPSGYASSDIASDAGSSDIQRSKTISRTDRFSKMQSESRPESRRSIRKYSKIDDDDIR
ncbi:hypothetical protein O6H91_03G014300 [Diphasiastrum complanatum]|uniref:Uncharacterized protein n=1 Tax=Diphasiastrum complanatum TaxID=34168 RepID=A0ACC2E3V4_DIPCM|nr:hypothetical protein O6H91_03G014300 [Diphasiastrum complanatum]